MRGLPVVSFRTKLQFVVAATSVLTVLLACSSLVAYDIVSAQRALERDLQSLADVVGANSQAALAFSDAASAEQNLASLRVRPNIVSAALYAADGTALAAYLRPGPEAPPPPDRTGSEGTWTERGHIAIVHRVVHDGELVGRLFIRSDTRAIQERIKGYGLIALVAVIASVLLGMLVSARLQRVVSGPVLALANAARTVSRTRDYSVRVQTAARDELGDLTGHFNSMLEQIQARDASLRLIQQELEVQVLELQKEVAQRKEAEEALRRSEEQLIQSQKMEAVGLLAGGVAHDFNNLLTVICGQGQMALLKTDPSDPLHERLATIKEAGDRAAELTRQLLAFSRKQVLAPKPLPLDAVIANLGRMLRRLVGENITLDIVPGLGDAHVLADAGQLEQVVLNLVVNARDAMPGGGYLEISTRSAELHGGGEGELASAKPGRYAVIAVSDTGCGMEEEVRSRIFEPFYTTKGAGKGTGLGLSTVYGMVRQSGGAITVASLPGRGTTFEIYLPVCARGPAAAAASKCTPVRTGTETVLLVEDEVLVRQLARQMLSDAGYRVVEACGGAEALALCARHKGPIHVLLTDVIMPGMNGPEVARRVAASRPGIAVVYMSGYTGGDLPGEGSFDPDSNFVHKPFTPESLLGLVRTALDRAAALTAAPAA